MRGSSWVRFIVSGYLCQVSAHFRGGGVAALADRVELLAELPDARPVPPVTQRALVEGWLLSRSIERSA